MKDEDGFWQPHPKIWRFYDVLRFYASSFASMMSELSRVSVCVNLANKYHLPPDDEADREIMRRALKGTKPFMAELPLSRLLRSKFTRLESAVETADSSEITILLREFHNDLVVEMTSYWFLMIRPEQREFYEQSHPAFGESVSNVFPAAARDIAAASRCYALDEWTACVFHLMRVLEHGLRSLAAKVGLPEDAMAHENWKNIIDRIEKKIGELESTKKSPEKIEKMQAYSQAAAQFRYFKDAWRNHVTHGRDSYDSRETESVWNHTKEFMHSISTSLEGTV